MKFLFLDVEATGIDQEDRLLQVAYKIEDKTVNAFFKPPVPIKLTAMAVHHVTEKMVADKPPFVESEEFIDLHNISQDGAVLVAHNAPYDIAMLKKEGIDFPVFIDTLKVARFIDDGQFENHQMQYLRYFYDIEIQASAHDALGDILVLQQVFGRITAELSKREKLVADEVFARMIEISSQPSLLRKITFGKYRDSTVEEVLQKDRGYLEWLLAEKLKKPENDDDWIYTLKFYLEK